MHAMNKMNGGKNMFLKKNFTHFFRFFSYCRFFETPSILSPQFLSDFGISAFKVVDKPVACSQPEI
jgi:hypothetical protein